MLEVETRTCSDCNNYERPITGFPICKKKLMGVTANMLVTYKSVEGTCFEEKESNPN